MANDIPTLTIWIARPCSSWRSLFVASPCSSNNGPQIFSKVVSLVPVESLSGPFGLVGLRLAVLLWLKGEDVLRSWKLAVGRSLVGLCGGERTGEAPAAIRLGTVDACEVREVCKRSLTRWVVMTPTWSMETEARAAAPVEEDTHWSAGRAYCCR